MQDRPDTRIERDSLGDVHVPAERYWGAQTQRSVDFFKIGEERMPHALIRAFAVQKKAAARANQSLGLIEPRLAEAIAVACDEVVAGERDDEFPLVVWQTGSGTQTNMNLNEVIANRANELLGAKRGSRAPIHPNDHVNLGQSSNDSFPTAMHIAAVGEIEDRLLPALARLRNALEARAADFAGIVKLGRTHLQDAVPMTLGQEFAAYARQMANAAARVTATLPALMAVAQGGTAIGTGLNAHREFKTRFAAELSRLTGRAFRPADQPMEAIAAHDAIVECSGALNVAAVSLTKIAGDLRLLASGPRGGLGELTLPANEPGSSIMPGKVNPTQIEAAIMVAAQIMGNHVTVTIAGASGQLELNVAKPVLIYNLLQSIRLLADTCSSLASHAVDGLLANEERIRRHLESSVMIVTALSPHIGYDKAARIAKHALERDISVKDASLALGLVSASDFDRWIQPHDMIGTKKG